MTAYDPALSAKPDGIFGFFRRTKPDRNAAEGAGETNTNTLGDMARFIDDFQLEITRFTLGVAYDCVTGMDPRLARKIKQRAASGKPIAGAWLEEARAENSRHTGISLLTEVMNKLERNLDEFGHSAHSARSMTRDYNSVLAEHGADLAKQGGHASGVDAIVKLVRNIIDHTKALEQEMARSEQRSQAMRKQLDRARRSADEDHLTGLHNRRAFDAQLAKEIEHAKESGEPLCVGFCDIDHFKNVNDTHGHEAGDRVIRAVAHSLSKVTGDRCFIARHGGEEFGLLFRDRTLKEAGQLFDEAREVLSVRRMVNKATKEPIGSISFSGGLARYRDGIEPGLLLKDADEALYRAKREGRNRIVIAEAMNGAVPAP